MILPRTFVLTLARTQERYAATKQHLDSNGITSEPFYGIDGKAANLKALNDFSVNKPGEHINGVTVGICLTHFLAWKVFSYIGEDSFLILEEDAEFIPEWESKYSAALKSLPEDWDILFLGSCCCKGREHANLGNGLWEVRYPMCLHAYQVRRKALPVLLEAHQKIWAPLDIATFYDSFPKLRVYAILPSLAHQRGTQYPP